MAPDVRIGIVSYNTAELLDRCLTSIPAAMGDLTAEVVVVDNASADHSVAVANAHAGVRVEASGTNDGYAKAMNRALAGSTAPVLIALNPDTEPGAGSLAHLVATLEQQPRAGLVAPALQNLDGSAQHSVHRFPSVAGALVMGFVPPTMRSGRIGERWWLEDHVRLDRAADIDWAVGAVHAIRLSAVVDADHVYSERWFMYAEDMDLCWRLRRDGWAVLYEPAVPIVHVGNAAGAVAWGEQRDARWLAATYDWYAQAHGRAAARVYAAANCAGLGAKWMAARAMGDRAHADRLRVLLALHRAHVGAGASAPIA